MPCFELLLIGRCSFYPSSKKAILHLYLHGPNSFHLPREKREKARRDIALEAKCSHDKAPTLFSSHKGLNHSPWHSLFLSDKIMKYLITGRVHWNSYFCDSLYCLMVIYRRQDWTSPSQVDSEAYFCLAGALSYLETSAKDFVPGGPDSWRLEKDVFFWGLKQVKMIHKPFPQTIKKTLAIFTVTWCEFYWQNKRRIDRFFEELWASL